MDNFLYLRKSDLYLNKSIKLKLIISINSLILVLVIGMALFAYNQSKDVVEELLLLTVEDTVDQYGTILGESIKSNINEVVGLDTSWFDKKEAFIDDMDHETILWSYWASQNVAFKNNAANKEHIESLFVADPDGNYNSSLGNSGNIADKPFFKETITTLDLVISQPFISKETGDLVFAILRPVIVKDKLRVILGGMFKVDFLHSYLEKMNINGEGYGWVIDQNNQIIVHPQENFIGKDIYSLSLDKSFKNIVQKMADGNKGYGTYIDNKDKMWIAFAPIKLNDWSIAITANSNRILSPLGTIKNGSIWMVIFAIIIGVITTYIIARKITESIVKLSNIADKVSQGDLTYDLSTTDRKDEVGVLMNAVNRMIVNLRDMIEHIKNISSTVTESSKELYISGEHVNKSAGIVGTEVEHLAAGAEEQTAQIEEMVSNIKNLTGQMQDIGESSSKISDVAVNVMSNIDKGNQSVNNSIDKINHVKVNTSEISEDVSKLDEVSAEIGSIVGIN